MDQEREVESLGDPNPNPGTEPVRTAPRLGSILTPTDPLNVDYWDAQTRDAATTPA